jgi:hypothetical protein
VLAGNASQPEKFQAVACLRDPPVFPAEYRAAEFDGPVFAMENR